MYGLKPVPFRLEVLNQRWLTRGLKLGFSGLAISAGVHLRTGLFAGGRRRFVFAALVLIKPCAISALPWGVDGCGIAYSFSYGCSQEGQGWAIC
jgi:hypothetical protein